jgi:hypothetical protein
MQLGARSHASAGIHRRHVGPPRRGPIRTAPPPHEDFGPSDARDRLTPIGRLERIAPRNIRSAVSLWERSVVSARPCRSIPGVDPELHAVAAGLYAGRRRTGQLRSAMRLGARSHASPGVCRRHVGPLRRGFIRTAPPPHEDFGPCDACDRLAPNGLLERIATRSLRPAA